MTDFRWKCHSLKRSLLREAEKAGKRERFPGAVQNGASFLHAELSARQETFWFQFSATLKNDIFSEK